MTSNNDQFIEHQQYPTTNEVDLHDKTVADINDQNDETKLSDAVEEISIYNIRTKFRRNLILLVISLIAFLLPFCETIYFPALNDIAISLNTSVTIVTDSVSIYLFMDGLGSLVWGPLSDRFGRKIIMIIGLIVFVIASVVCIFAPTIAVLIIFRGLEGFAIVTTLVISQSIVGDIYPQEQRGTASGWLFVPFNIGSVLGPMIGGPLSNAFGWRATFVLLTILGIISIVAMSVLVPETHQYFAKERFHKTNPTKRVIDAVPNEKPSFGKPWKALVFLVDMTLFPYICLVALAFGTLYTCFTLFSIYLANAPYNYSQTNIGLLFIPSGVSLFLGSLFGGWSSDKAGKYYGYEKCLEGRLVPALILSALVPVGTIIFGWIFHYQLSVVGAIIGQVLIGFSEASILATVSAYLTIKKQNEAAVAAGALAFADALFSGLLITFAVPMENAMGIGPYYCFLAALNVVIIAVVGVLVYKSIARKGYVSM